MIKRLKLNIQRFATNGALTTPANSDGTTFTFAWSRQSYSIADNKSTIYWEVRVNAAYTYYSNAVKLGATTVDGTQVHGGGTWSDISKGTTTLISGTKDIYHNPNGTKTFAVSISGWTWGSTWTSADNSSSPFVLDTIPRYTSVTKWAMTDRTETSITLSWQTADVCSQIKYKADNGSYTTANVNSNSGSVTISGLSVNASHTLYFIPKRKDSNLWGDGSADNPKTTTQSTLQYPYVSNVSVSDLTIGNEQTLTISNPKSRSNITVYMKKDSTSGTTLYSGTTSGTSIKFTPVATTLYNSIKSSKTATCVYYCVWDGHTVASEVKTKTYKVNENDCRPIFNNFTYADTNATTVALTGDNQKIVKGYSNVTATVSVANKAELNATYPADNMVKYNLIVGNDPRQSVPYSSSEEVSVTVPNATSGSITLNAEDSRQVIKEVSKTATLIEYTNIQKGNINITRNGNVGEAVTLTFDGTYWNNSFGSVTNTITSANVRYRYKKTTDSDWSGWNGTTTIAPVLSGNTFSFSNGIIGDTSSGFNTQYSYNIEVEVSDKLSSTVFTFVLGTGIPTIAVADDGIAIKQPYDDTDDSILQVNGNTKIKGNIDFRNTNNASIEWKENGFGDKFRLIPDFGGADDSNKFKVQGTVGGSGTDPTNWTDLMTITGKSGNVNVSGSLFSKTARTKLETIDGRISNANIAHTYENNKAHLQLLIASSSMTSNKPVADGFITHYSWDNNNKCSAQLYVPQGDQSTKQLQFRTENNAGTWTGWEDIYRAKTLYENSSGTTGTITLPETCANFKYIDIFYAELNRSERSFVRTYSPNGQDLQLTIIIRGGTSSSDLRENTKTINFNGTSLTTKSNTGAVWFTTYAFYAVNEIRIMKVVGYR